MRKAFKASIVVTFVIFALFVVKVWAAIVGDDSWLKWADMSIYVAAFLAGACSVAGLIQYEKECIQNGIDWMKKNVLKRNRA